MVRHAAFLIGAALMMACASPPRDPVVEDTGLQDTAASDDVGDDATILDADVPDTAAVADTGSTGIDSTLADTDAADTTADSWSGTDGASADTSVDTKPKLRAIGSPCVDVTQCESGECSTYGWCTKSCVKIGDCGFNEYGRANLCLMTGSSSKCVPTCTTQPDCDVYGGTKSICDGVGQKFCGSGACKNSGSGCASASDCCSGLACVAATCVTCKALSVSCTSSAECCAGLTCAGGTCKTSACNGAGTSCSSYADCCSGLKCLGGKCQSCGSKGDKGCYSDSDCCSPYKCMPGCAGGNVCEVPPPAPVLVTATPPTGVSAACSLGCLASGQTCPGKKVFEGCSAAADCAGMWESWVCLGVSGFSSRLCTRPCSSDGDCAAVRGYTGDRCVRFGTAGYCLPYCTAGSACSYGRCQNLNLFPSGGGYACAPW